MAGSTESLVRSDEPPSEIDLRAIGSALHRRGRLVLVPTLVAFLAVTLYVLTATPRYTAETQILLENQETFFTRPDRVNLPSDVANQLDETAVASQVQLVSSPDIARRVIDQLKLRSDPDFDAAARGPGLFRRGLALVGLAHVEASDDDVRIVEDFLKKLSVFSPSKTRVITIQFSAREPKLAARIANKVAEDYLAEQSSAKRAMAKAAADALGSQIAGLRVKLAKADDAREQYRLQSGLLAGGNNMTVSGQQLADINSDLSKARTTQADAQAKASMIRDLIKDGKAADVTDVTNNDIVRRIYDERANAQAQLALESRTLLPQHPRIKELTAQLDQYDLALKNAARQAAMSLENEAKIAGARVANLEAVLAQQKKAVGVANVDEVHLRALDRVAQSLKDQLESSTTKYEEALARQSSDATPSDARVITRATPPQDPSFPKKIPFILFGTIAAFVLTSGYVVAAELLSGRATLGSGAPGPRSPVEPMPPRRSRPAVQEAAASAPAAVAATPWKSAGGRGASRRAAVGGNVETIAVESPAIEAAARGPGRVDADAMPMGEPRRFAAAARSLFRLPGGLRRTPVDSEAPSADIDDLVFKPIEGASGDPSPSIARASGPRSSASTGSATSRLMAGANLLTSAVAYFRMFGRSAAETRGGSLSRVEVAAAPAIRWGDEPEAGDPVAPLAVAAASSNVEPTSTRPLVEPHAVESQSVEPRAASERSIARLVDRIVPAHVPGRGLHVVGTSLVDGQAESRLLVELARALSTRGRSILVDLNRTPAKLAMLRDVDGQGLATLMTMAGLAELLAGDASFAEVIHRDEASRLHFIPTGTGDADFRDFDLVLDALSETYDFVVLLIPPFPRSEIARVMAPYADFIVLSAGADRAEATLTRLRRDLIEAGAREVLVAGAGEPGERLSA